MPELIADAGPLAGRRLTVDDELTIGRVQGDLVVDDPKLSRRHAVIRVTGGELEVEDLGSTNGTFIDGKRLTAPTRLAPGARLQLGETVLIAEAPPEPVLDATQLDVGPATQLDAGATEIVRPATPAAPTAAAAPATPAEPAPTTLRPAASNPPTVGQPAAPAPAAAAKPAPAAGRGAAAPARGAASAPADVGIFQPPPVLHGGLATRSWVPVAASYGSAAAAAAGLIAYFALR